MCVCRFLSLIHKQKTSYTVIFHSLPDLALTSAPIYSVPSSFPKSFFVNTSEILVSVIYYQVYHQISTKFLQTMSPTFSVFEATYHP